MRESGKEGGWGGERGRKERKEKGNERGYIHGKKRFLLFGIASECPDYFRSGYVYRYRRSLSYLEAGPLDKHRVAVVMNFED